MASPSQRIDALERGGNSQRRRRLHAPFDVFQGPHQQFDAERGAQQQTGPHRPARRRRVQHRVEEAAGGAAAGQRGADAHACCRPPLPRRIPAGAAGWARTGARAGLPEGAEHQHHVHQRHPVDEEALELGGNPEQWAEADQVVDPVAPELDAAEDAPEEAVDHQADDHQNQQQGADERRPLLDEDAFVVRLESAQPGAALVAHHFSPAIGRAGSQRLPVNGPSRGRPGSPAACRGIMRRRNRAVLIWVNPAPCRQGAATAPAPPTSPVFPLQVEAAGAAAARRRWRHKRRRRQGQRNDQGDEARHPWPTRPDGFPSIP